MLVLRPGALGDTLLAVPALRALRRAGHPVTLAAHGGAAGLLAALGEIDRGLAFDDPSLAWLFSGPPRSDANVVAWMSARPHGLPRGALVAPSRPERLAHCACYLLETLAPTGVDLAWDAAPLKVLAQPYDEVLIHPGSGSPHKNWPPERFDAVIRALRRPVRLIVGEADREAAARLPAVPRLEHPTLAELAARLAGCHAYLGNDSGVSHLAGLCGARTLAMFGPTDPRVWRPIGPDVHVLPFETAPSDVAAQLEG